MKKGQFSIGDYYYAHRGLWSAEGPLENTLAAYEAAAEKGFGIEFDVRLTADGVPICFHDDTLDRMCGRAGRIDELDWAVLKGVLLKDGRSGIPSLDEMLAQWPQDLPLLLEIKTGAMRAAESADAIAEVLTGFDGKVGVKSFQKDAVANLPEHLFRGLLIEPVSETDKASFEAKLAYGVSELNVDFVSTWHTDAPAVRAINGFETIELAVWTVRSPEDMQACLPYAKGQIFEGFDPRNIASAGNADISPV